MIVCINIYYKLQNDLGLKCEALQELPELSTDLQKHNTHFYRGSKNIANIIKISEKRNKCHQPHWDNAITAAKSLTSKRTAPLKKKI